MPATLNDTATRCHISLNVSDLARAVDFYRVLFGREPAKRRPDYAKFELADPPLVLSLEPNRHAAGGALNHLGFRLPDSETLVQFQQRLEAAGIHSQREEGVECCYARQTKFWVTDPDRNLWEFYVLEEDIDHRGAGQSLEEMLPSAEAEPVPVAWEHRLDQPVPAAIPHGDSSVSEVLLRGTFNAALPASEKTRLLREAQRALQPGGRIVLHTLVTERELPGGLRPLPGPAARVQRVPLEQEPIQALEDAGFVAVTLEKFAAAPCFQQDGIGMRELLVSARKAPSAADAGEHLVLYKGPYREVVDDEGQIYPRGERVLVSAQSWAQLKSGPCADQFTFLTAADGAGCSG
ncbi:MAG TPA: ArsI/CadI family heavy metal resistance metalloenzyme [Gemmataceae bacterium]|nr:ArsI/CadI family heavy metal resistance metalloenzyme [Gemmataceae bacterium]